MKKILKAGVLVLFFALCSTQAFAAEVLKVESLSDFSTLNPPKYISLKALSTVNIDNGIVIPEGVILKGELADVVSPKRLKRNATFSIKPISYVDEKGKVIPISSEYLGKFSPKFEVNKVEVAKSAALSVGDHFVKGVSMGYHAVEGAVKNEEGNRFKSSAVSLYKNSPLAYVENGQELEIKQHDLFSLRFKSPSEPEEEVVETTSQEMPAEEVKTPNLKVKNEKHPKEVKKDAGIEAGNVIKEEVKEDIIPASKLTPATKVQANEPEVHWVQQGAKGQTLKFTTEAY